MKRSTKGLWVSIIIVVVVVALSVGAFATGRLEPTLGLDLKGGVSVILSAPDGTPPDTMQQALENIRNRVDAFGVGEPDIALSGNTGFSSGAHLHFCVFMTKDGRERVSIPVKFRDATGEALTLAEGQKYRAPDIQSAKATISRGPVSVTR